MYPNHCVESRIPGKLSPGSRNYTPVFLLPVHCTAGALVAPPKCRHNTVVFPVLRGSYFVKTSSTTTVNINPCLRYKGKTEEERTLVIFENISMNSHIHGELSTGQTSLLIPFLIGLFSKITK